MIFFFYPIFILFFILSFLLPLFLRDKRGKGRDYHKKNRGKNPDMDDYFHSQLSAMFTDERNHNSYTGDIFRLADKRKGRITISDVIIQTGLPLRESELVMDNLVDGQHVCMEVNDKGWIIYEFPEIISRHKALRNDVTASEEKNLAAFIFLDRILW